ncbi:dioxygenase family protein [Nesterenkonia ebinurensis]|uniref:dioxygenase family protein n=1 Tax=Nesterenkonia ebinurensis TaxID=2608252 RepID=UPI00123E1B7A|nr:3,4-dioxygenase subunit beta [Nesterenkonia ebinurensis]
MLRVPEPEQTPEGPSFEGRLLQRPQEEVVDQGASFDLQTLISRRGILGLSMAGVSVTALAACSVDGSGSTTTPAASASSAATSGSTGASASAAAEVPETEIPDETSGPYPGDGSNGPDVLEESGIIRQDITTSLDGGETVQGVPLEVRFTLLNAQQEAAPFAGAALYAWMCDAQGRYSMYSEGVEDQTWLRGVQVADEAGELSFTAIYPACYTGRWPHIHFEVYQSVEDIEDYTNAIAVSQMALPEDISDGVYELAAYEGSSRNMDGVSLETDNVFGNDSAEHQMATVTGSLEEGYTASLTVLVDPETSPSGSGEAPGVGPGDPGGRPDGRPGDGPTPTD